MGTQKSKKGGALTTYLVRSTVVSPYKWPYKLVTGVITPLSGVIALLRTGTGTPLAIAFFSTKKVTKTNKYGESEKPTVFKKLR